MLDVKKKVFSSLIGDSALITLLGNASKVQFYYPNDFNALPIVTYQELNQLDESQGYWDNAPNSVASTIQIDVWTSGSSTTNIAKSVDRVMHGLLFSADFSADLYEPNTKIQHRVMRYSRSFTADDLD